VLKLTGMTQGEIIAGWEGWFTPAQDPHSLNVEWKYILSGGKPPFPTCNYFTLNYSNDGCVLRFCTLHRSAAVDHQAS
jgi:hypothetical protein